MKKVLALTMMLLFVAALAGAQEFGSIRGKVIDKDGNPLPGVNVTLTGSKTAPRSVVTSPEGNFRFLNLPVASDYALTMELPGFKTVVREALVVSFGRNVELEIAMDQAAIEEQVTVVGQTPIIDTRRTQVGVNITQEQIMQLPNARNPFVLLQLAPGMLIDREDVGGNEGGQQSAYYGHGSASTDSTWNVDGGNITDNAALGAAPAYLNVSGFEEIQINYGNNDVRSQTGGVQLNFITRRGGNNFNGTFYLTAAKNQWQATNISQQLLDYGYTGAGINKIYLYGVNFGGPAIKDKLWFFGSYGIQDISARTLAGTNDNTFLESGYFRLDAQITKNTRANAFYEYDSKIKSGRTSWGSTVQGPNTLWNQTGPTPIYKGEVEQMFGNVFLDAKVIYTHNTFHLLPVLGEHTTDGSGPYMHRDYYPTFFVSGNIDDYGTTRPQTNAGIYGNVFVENVIGADHEFKFGAEYTHSRVTTFDIYEANLQTVFYEPGWDEVWIIRNYLINLPFDRYSAFAQDTLTWGRLSLNLGLRYDNETSKVGNESTPAALYMSNYLTALSITGIDPGIRSGIFSPRVSLIYDITGDGKNVVKVNAARYGTQTGYDFASFLNPAPWAEIDLRWVDLNGDERVTQNELFGTDWATGEPTVDPNDPDGWSYFSGFDPANPGAAETTNVIDPSYKTPLLDEISVSFEREIIPDFAARVEGYYKNRHRYSWDRGILTSGLETHDNYYLIGTDAFTGATYYGRVEAPYGHYRTNWVDGTLNPDGSLTGNTTKLKAHETYWAGELVVTKRLTHHWMLEGSITLSSWTYYHGNAEDVWPYNLNNYDFYEGGVVAPESGGSGITDTFVNSHWIGRLSGLYQFPYGISLGFAFNARQGYVIRPYTQVNMGPSLGFEDLYANAPGEVGRFGDTRLPNFFELNLRLEKVFNITEKLHVTAAVDAFNVLNSATALSEQARLASMEYLRTLRILNPRVFRADVRIDF